MNKYYITFYFKDEFRQIVMTANQLANSIIGDSDDLFNFKYKNTTDAPYVTFRVNGEGFDACFTSNGKLNIALTETGDIIEKDIPWRVLMIKDNKDNVIYNITTDLI